MSIEELSRAIDVAQRIVIFTGAGISTESGIADFRSPGGIWSKIQPIEFDTFCSNEEARMEDWRRRFHFQKQFEAAPVNQGHEAIAHIMRSNRSRVLITQNIDGLHQRSGVSQSDIIEVHGNGTRATCIACESPWTLEAAENYIIEHKRAPKCSRCGDWVKADVISFGQPMPQGKMLRALDCARDCDLFIVLGSSLVVQPAARLPEIAKQSGAQLAIINRDSTPLDPIADVVLHLPLGETLNKALEKTVLGAPNS